MINIDYNNLLDMDIRTYNNYIKGYIKKREVDANDEAFVGHIVAGKIAAAVWADKSYKHPIKEIKFSEDDRDLAEKSRDSVIQTLKRKGLI